MVDSETAGRCTVAHLYCMMHCDGKTRLDCVVAGSDLSIRVILRQIIDIPVSLGY